MVDEGLLFRTNEIAFVQTKRKLLHECDFVLHHQPALQHTTDGLYWWEGSIAAGILWWYLGKGGKNYAW